VPLTPAEKQKAYRDRKRARLEAQGLSPRRPRPAGNGNAPDRDVVLTPESNEDFLARLQREATDTLHVQLAQQAFRRRRAQALARNPLPAVTRYRDARW